MPSPQAAYKAFKMNGSGCIFEHYGRIPESTYETNTYNSPMEQAVGTGDLQSFLKLIQEGNEVSVRLKVGRMSCIEYAAMMGYVDILRALLEHSVNANMLRQYFSLDDVVDRAYLISRNKSVFFEREALAEANRYEAALYTAVAYNQPAALALMLTYLGPRELRKHSFLTNGNGQKMLSAIELAQARGHSECYDILFKKDIMSLQGQEVNAC